jgi:DNA invertase Pin-like site-specific DNA recombinase
MSSTRHAGISYSRFSDPKQGKGDSEDRQDRLYRNFCQRHNLSPVAEIFADRGRSGYKDEHRKKGRLGQLIALAKDDRFEPGTVIVVEAWDRLGRLRPDRQTELVAELLRTGVRIGVCRLDDIFSEDDFGTHKWTTLAVFIQLAYQESKQKAERVAASWEKRRQKAREKGELLTTRLPAWLEQVRGEVRPIPERAAAVRRMFQLAASGYGYTRIITALNKEGFAPFGKVVVRENRVRSQFSGKWTRPYVALILNDRRAIGEFQPRKDDDKPDGPPLSGYFPAVVSEDEFLLARAGQAERLNGDAKGRKLGTRQGRYVNVFKGLLTHARDGEGFLLHNKGTKGNPQLSLINATGNGGRGRCYTFPYPVFEEAILSRLREVDPRDVLPKGKEPASKVDVLRAKLANVRQDLAGIQEELKAGFSKALAEVLRDREAAEEQLANELQEELARSVKPASRAWQELPSLVDLIKESDDPDDVRLALRPVLRRIVESAWVLIVPQGSKRVCVVQFFFVGGGRRDYLVFHRTAGNQRKEIWWPWSLEDVTKLGGLDLRRREDARDLERDLGEKAFQALEEKALQAIEEKCLQTADLHEEGAGSPTPTNRRDRASKKRLR